MSPTEDRRRSRGRRMDWFSVDGRSGGRVEAATRAGIKAQCQELTALPFTRAGGYYQGRGRSHEQT